jgi:hypothetical protein
LIFVIVLLTACATKPKPQLPHAPEWDAIPAGVLGALCQRLQMDTVASGAPLTIIRTTQPLATERSLMALGEAAGTRPNKTRLAEALPAGQRSLPLNIPAMTSGACIWNAADSVNPRMQSDRMVVELSAPLPNPFVRNAAGMFARVSLGGENPAWYWIGLVPRGTGWTMGPIIVLGV